MNTLTRGIARRAIVLFLPVLLPASFAHAQHLDPMRDVPRTRIQRPAQPDRLTVLPQWIWGRSTRPQQTLYFRSEVRLRQVPRYARLSIACDNAFTLYINGQKVAQTVSRRDGFEWRQIQTVDVTRWLQQGQNSIAVKGYNEDGVAGLLTLLKIDNKRFLSGNTWRYSEQETSGWEQPNFPEQGWESIALLGPVGTQPWVGLVHYPEPRIEPVAGYLRALFTQPNAEQADPDFMLSSCRAG